MYTYIKTLVLSIFISLSLITTTHAGLIIEKPERTIFQEQTLPVRIYTEPIESDEETTDVDITLTISNAHLTNLKKIVLAPKITRRENSTIQTIPATKTTPAKKIITEKLTYAGKIKANKLMFSLYLEAVEYGEFTVTGDGGIGTYKILPIEIDSTNNETNTPTAQTNTTSIHTKPVITSINTTKSSDTLNPKKSDTIIPMDTLVKDDTTVSVNNTDELIKDTTSSSEKIIACNKTCDETTKSNYLIWIIIWILSLLLMLYTGYYIGKIEHT